MNPEGSEISVETGQRAEAVEKHYHSLGGAANVVANLVALKPQKVTAIGVIGMDMHGRELIRQLKDLNVNTESLFVQSLNFDTYTFSKKYHGDVEISRADFGVFNKRSKEADDHLLKSLRFVLENGNVLIFNQQIPGSISQTFIDGVNALFEEFEDKIIIVDSRHFHRQFQRVSLKLNQIELADLIGADINDQDPVPFSKIGYHSREAFKKTKKPLFITCGRDGMVVADENGVHPIPGIQITSKIDTVGAGDTAIAALSLCLGAGFTSIQAAKLANLAAAVSIQKLFTTGTASPDEILELDREANFVYQPELAGNISRAAYLNDSDIELCYQQNDIEFGAIKHLVFDHDGTLSTLREGWPEIMLTVMMKAILGPKINSTDKVRLQTVRQKCLDYIESSTGMQTIVQMNKLVQMVESFDMVPKTQILDALGYKKIFNDALMTRVNQRINKIHNGELDRAAFRIKGAIHFLNRLKMRNVKLHLASGTDQEDVINEAKLLGYAHLFDNIYGSINDVTKYSKKILIDRILKENQLIGNELAVFGDGPVEMQECRRFNGIAIGVASDEVNPGRLHPGKRTRLIKSGAQIVVSNYLQGSKLINLLFTDKDSY
jgi:fructose-1-phosphate kinase PfkB-like protein/phosphoglycolate phosphatase-like HAD superfamily hydrolase